MQVARDVAFRADRLECNDFVPPNETNVGNNRRIHSAYTHEIRGTSVDRNGGAHQAKKSRPIRCASN